MFLTSLGADAVKIEVDTETLQACLICLSWDGKLHNIHEQGLDQIYVELMGTWLSPWDSMPQHLCGFCRAWLLKAHALRARAFRAHHLLKRALLNRNTITNEYIHSVDRHANKLTHSLSCIGGKVVKCYIDHDEQTPNEPVTNFIVVQETNTADIVENNMEEFDFNSESFKNDKAFIDNFKVDEDINDNFKDNNLAGLSDIEIENTIGENESRKRPTRKNKENKVKLKKKKGKHKAKKDSVEEDYKKYDFKVDNFKDRDITESSVVEIETAIDQNESIVLIKRPTRKNKTNKVKLKKEKDKQKTKKVSMEEDYKEFEKKYDFEVQCLTDKEMEEDMERRKLSDKYLKGTYKCDLCYKSFLASNIYENHMKTHAPARGDNECGLCRVRFHYPVKLRQHVQNAHRLRFRCVKCGERAHGKASAVLHAAYHAGTTFPCTHCDKRFLKKTSRSSHMRAAHPAENAAGGACEECGETFTSRTGLKAHKTRSHNKGNSPELRCRKCSTQFHNADALRRHRETMPDNKCNPNLSACEQCGETCPNADELILHKHTQHAVQLYTCDTCSKSFTSKPSLGTHIDRVHRHIRPPKVEYSDASGQRDWLHWATVCEHCGKRLSCMATLKIHMNKHTGERPYKCKLCPKAYMTPYGLNNHQAAHTGERKWQCPECPATFLHQSSVYQHRKIHTGERSHQCQICDKYFTQSGSLYTHVKYVHRKETPPPRKRNKKT